MWSPAPAGMRCTSQCLAVRLIMSRTLARGLIAARIRSKGLWRARRPEKQRGIQPRGVPTAPCNPCASAFLLSPPALFLRLPPRISAGTFHLAPRAHRPLSPHTLSVQGGAKLVDHPLYEKPKLRTKMRSILPRLLGLCCILVFVMVVSSP